MLRLQHKLSTFDHTSAHAKSNRLKGDECMLKAQNLLLILCCNRL